MVPLAGAGAPDAYLLHCALALALALALAHSAAMVEAFLPSVVDGLLLPYRF
jgi:hypothetical protein